MYIPEPIDTKDVVLDEEITALSEKLARLEIWKPT